MKTCRKCKQIKEDYNFYKNRTHNDGLNSYCCDCEIKSSNLAKEIRMYGRPRIEIFERDNFACVECGRTVNIEIHHKDNTGYYSRRYKGKINNDLSNLITLCKPCHTKKHPSIGNTHYEKMQKLDRQLR